MPNKTPENPIPARANFWLAVGIAAFQLFVLFGVPLLLLPGHAVWLIALLPLIWLHSTHWALVHEGIHKLLLPGGRANDGAARALSILMGASFHVLKFGHLIHHQLNRDWHPEFVAEKNLAARGAYYFTLLAGLYLSEVAASLLLAITPRRLFVHLAHTRFLKDYPQVVTAGERFYYARGNIARLRLDTALIVALYAAAFYIYGAYWPLLALYIASRALVISFMDNIYHYNTPGDNSVAGKELYLPMRLSRLLLHGNYHGVHHRDPALPWNALPVAHAAAGSEYHGGFLAHAGAQLRGPVVLP